MLQKIGRVGLIVAVVAVLLAPMVAAIYFARDAGVQIGRFYEKAAENERLMSSLDLAKVELGEAEYKIQTLEGTLEQAKSEMAVMIPIWDAAWCEAFTSYGMDPKVLEGKASLVLQTIKYLKAVTKAQGITTEAAYCVSTMTTTHSKVRDEIYVLATRAFKGGETEAFYVYWIPDPENADQYIIGGHYDVGAQEWRTHVREGSKN